MKATYNPNAKTKFTASHRKETRLERQFSAIIPGTSPNRAGSIVTLRIYRPGATAYAALWVGSGDTYTNGTGKAGGGGYHKASAAAAEAIRNAGFTLDQDIDGRGDTAIEEAVLAIAAALGHPNAMLHVAHG